MIVVGRGISIDESEIQEEFVRASGPGGQNVNKAATAVQLRFDVRNSPALPAAVRERLIGLAGRRITRNGVLMITARRHRTQEQNRRDARERLVDLIRRGSQFCTTSAHRRSCSPAVSDPRRRGGQRRSVHILAVPLCRGRDRGAVLMLRWLARTSSTGGISGRA